MHPCARGRSTACRTCRSSAGSGSPGLRAGLMVAAARLWRWGMERHSQSPGHPSLCRSRKQQSRTAAAAGVALQAPYSGPRLLRVRRQQLVQHQRQGSSREMMRAPRTKHRSPERARAQTGLGLQKHMWPVKWSAARVFPDDPRSSKAASEQNPPARKQNTARVTRRQPIEMDKTSSSKYGKDGRLQNVEQHVPTES